MESDGANSAAFLALSGNFRCADYRRLMYISIPCEQRSRRTALIGGYIKGDTISHRWHDRLTGRSSSSNNWNFGSWRSHGFDPFTKVSTVAFTTPGCLFLGALSADGGPLRPRTSLLGSPGAVLRAPIGSYKLTPSAHHRPCALYRSGRARRRHAHSARG